MQLWQEHHRWHSLLVLCVQERHMNMMRFSKVLGWRKESKFSCWLLFQAVRIEALRLHLRSLVRRGCDSCQISEEHSGATLPQWLAVAHWKAEHEEGQGPDVLFFLPSASVEIDDGYIPFSCANFAANPSLWKGRAHMSTMACSVSLMWQGVQVQKDGAASIESSR